jgi:hypothetical protein
MKCCSHCNCRPLYSTRSYYDLPVTCHFRLELMEIKKMHAVYGLRCGLWMYVSSIFVGTHKLCLYRQAS